MLFIFHLFKSHRISRWSMSSVLFKSLIVFIEISSFFFAVAHCGDNPLAINIEMKIIKFVN